MPWRSDNGTPPDGSSDRGAQPNLWQAAGLGLMNQVAQFFDPDRPPTPEEITGALWLAGHGGQQTTAEYLLDRGGDLNGIGYDQLTTLDAARRSGADDLAAWLVEHGAETADDMRSAKA